MTIARKKYAEKEKLSILKEGEIKGVNKTLSKYGLYPGTYYYWRKRTGHWLKKERLKEMKQLQKENEMMRKQIIAEKELESKLQDKLLKTIQVQGRKLLAGDYISRGLTRDVVLGICEINKYQYYNDPTGMKGGARPSTTTIKIAKHNEFTI